MSEVRKCTVCDGEMPSWKKKTTKTCSAECKETLRKAVLADPAVRKKISYSRKKYLSENPESFFWTKESKFRSIPCEHFKKILTERGIFFIEEYMPLKDRFFRIDIAFPEQKIGIEINGSQHYESDLKTLKPYYQERHDAISKDGWKLLEVFYKNVWNESIVEDIIINVTAALDGTDTAIYRNYSVDKQNIRKNKKHTLKEERKKFLAEGHDKKWFTDNKCCRLDLCPDRLKECHDAILDSKPGTHGWIMRASRKLGKSHTQIRRLINKYFPEFSHS